MTEWLDVLDTFIVVVGFGGFGYLNLGLLRIIIQNLISAFKDMGDRQKKDMLDIATIVRPHHYGESANPTTIPVTPMENKIDQLIESMNNITEIVGDLQSANHNIKERLEKIENPEII